HHAHLVTIARVRSNRTFYYRYVADEAAAPSAGHPTWYGEAFKLTDPETWTPPPETLTWWESSRRGKRQRVEIQGWHNLLMRGKHTPQRLPMQHYPFTLVRIMRYDEAGNPLYQRPLWLLVMGQRRGELSLQHIYDAYQLLLSHIRLSKVQLKMRYSLMWSSGPQMPQDMLHKSKIME
ncbi:MAG: hypothetical protein KDD73_17025, partial [Anaerolineales bacterium]|nr:hypothetical protein [Anaerolineales bacterium]